MGCGEGDSRCWNWICSLVRSMITTLVTNSHSSFVTGQLIWRKSFHIAMFVLHRHYLFVPQCVYDYFVKVVGVDLAPRTTAPSLPPNLRRVSDHFRCHRIAIINNTFSRLEFDDVSQRVGIYSSHTLAKISLKGQPRVPTLLWVF